MLVQNKVPKQKDTPHRGLRIPCASRQNGRLHNSRFQRSDIPRLTPPNFFNHHIRGSRGFNVKTVRSFTVWWERNLLCEMLLDLKIAPTTSSLAKCVSPLSVSDDRGVQIKNFSYSKLFKFKIIQIQNYSNPKLLLTNTILSAATFVKR